MTDLSFRLTEADGEHPPTVIASGDIDFANVAAFEEVVAQAAGNASAITVDMRGESYCDSAAVQALFSVAATTKLTLIIRPTGPMRTLLKVTQLDRVATITAAG
jgi:anti-sigma B factor antagonist